MILILKKTPMQKMYQQLSYLDVVKDRLKVMDSTAVTLCMENNLPIIVFNLKQKNNLKNLILGKHIGTKVCEAQND